MADNIILTESQATNLKNIIKAGKIAYTDASLDRRSVRALAARDLVKVTAQKSGDVVSATAKGKKLIN